MKKLLIVCITALALQSCATVFGGRVDSCQRTKPDKTKGEPARAIRGGALVLDFLFCIPCIGIDFATNAIYKPCPVKTSPHE